MIICGTGHRPNKLGGYSDETFAELFRLAHDWLKENQPDKVISGMALGWDQALMEAAQALGCVTVAAIPFEGQERMWPKPSQEKFHKLLREATDIVYTSDPGYAPWKMQKRNEWMVDNCDRVLALWDGSDGGTGNCIKYVSKVGKPIINLWENYERTAV